MTIIHYIPTMDAKAGTAPAYVECLIRAMRNVAESHVITDDDLGDNAISAHARLKKIFKKLRPDIVHIHASWSHKAAFVEWEAKRMGLFVVLSVHGGLAPEVIDLEFWKKKLPRLIGYQFMMVRKCHALVAASETESEQLKGFGWKKRIVCIPHPTLFSKSDDETRDALLAIYHKVIDTNYLLRITDAEMQFVMKCAAISIWKENASFDITTEKQRAEVAKSALIQELNTLIEANKHLSFKRIYIYAHDNDVTDIMMEGAKEAGITMPPRIDVNALPRFKQKVHKDKNLRNFQKLCNLVSELTDGEKLEPTVTLSGTMSFRTLCDLFSRLRFSNYDEDRFADMTKKAGIKGFTAKLLNAFSSLFDMEEGYMPIMPKGKFNLRNR